MAAFVVDTNVPVVANGKSHADPDCVIASINALLEVRSGGGIVLDDQGLIFSEYRRYLNCGGEPGAGDAFMKWAWNVQADERQCERVMLTPRIGGNDDDFLEFPNDPDLAAFDRSDRKFVAVALTSLKEPLILNSVDGDWADHYLALYRNGVRVRFLCPQHVKPE